jgi:hypothetical protein
MGRVRPADVERQTEGRNRVNREAVGTLLIEAKKAAMDERTPRVTSGSVDRPRVRPISPAILVAPPHSPRHFQSTSPLVGLLRLIRPLSWSHVTTFTFQLFG